MKDLAFMRHHPDTNVTALYSQDDLPPMDYAEAPTDSPENIPGYRCYRFPFGFFSDEDMRDELIDYLMSLSS